MPTGPRIRDNGVFGTTTDNPLTAGAGAFNSAGLADLSPISAAHATVTLDPLKEFGDPEIVVVTSHSASATVASISRGQYNTAARSHPQGTLWVHAPLDEDFTEILTSGSRPGNPYAGQLIFETDTGLYVHRNAANDAWLEIGGWADYTPSNTNITVGSGTQVARFTRTGNTVFWSYRLTLSGSTIGSNAAVGLPVEAAGAQSTAIGFGVLIDTGTKAWVAACDRNAAGTGAILTSSLDTGTGRITSTAPFTWADTDIIAVSGSYEAA